MPVFSKLESKVKMVVYFDNGGAARFYSVIKENKKPWETIADKMTKRVLGNKYKWQFRKAMFYDNFTDREFKTIYGSQHTSPPTKTPDEFDPEKSIVKAIMVDMDHKPKVFYSRQNEEKKFGNDPLEIRAAMRNRLKAKFEYRKLTFEFR